MEVNRDPEEQEEDSEEDSPVWVPTMLDSTKTKIEKLEHDRRANANTKCLLCELANDDTGSTGKLAEILHFERDYRRTMQTDTLYKAIRDKYNREIVRRRREVFKDREVKEITLSMIRQHFEDNHDRDWKRMLEDRLDYLHASAEQLERSGLWIKNIKAVGDSPAQPNPKTFATYIGVTTKMENLYHRLTTTNSLAVSRVGKRTLPPRR